MADTQEKTCRTCDWHDSGDFCFNPHVHYVATWTEDTETCDEWRGGVKNMGTKQICGECKWHAYENASQGWVCTNPDSEYLTDWTDYSFSCDEWEERK